MREEQNEGMLITLFDGQESFSRIDHIIQIRRGKDSSSCSIQPLLKGEKRHDHPEKQMICGRFLWFFHIFSVVRKEGDVILKLSGCGEHGVLYRIPLLGARK